jgi:hypothetical protein
VLTLRQGDCKLFELYAAAREGSGWHAYSGAVWDLTSNRLPPRALDLADAAGLPILPGLARRDEADAGAIHHALRITVPVTQKAYIHPATHWASSNTDADQPPMGLRVGSRRATTSAACAARRTRSRRRSRPTARSWPTTRARRACTSAASSTRAGTTRT